MNTVSRVVAGKNNDPDVTHARSTRLLKWIPKCPVVYSWTNGGNKYGGLIHQSVIGSEVGSLNLCNTCCRANPRYSRQTE
jgi:hypothetical protein